MGTDISQVKNYAYAVAEDERFAPLETRWSFWVISNELDPTGRREARQSDRPRGQVYKSDDGRIEVWCKTWSEVLEGASARMRFVEEHLKANLDKETSLKYLTETYDKYLSGVIDVDDDQDEDEYFSTPDSTHSAGWSR